MAAIHLQTLPDREEQLHLMQEDARYDVADDGDKDHTCIPDPSVFTDIASRPAPPKIPKVFVSNDCTFNCAYCGCRCSNERRHRYSHEPREMAEMAVSEAVKNGHGIFVTSAICRNADYTEERIVATLQYMREELHYPGFIHAKTFVVDDEYGTVGTINLDYRSLYLHFECGVWLCRTRSVLQIKEDFLAMLPVCQEITLEQCQHVPWYRKLGRACLRIFAPLM